MAMYRIIKKLSFADQEAATMAEAYERALADLGITDRFHPQTESIAMAILHLMRDGENDPVRLARFACQAIAPRANRAEQSSPEA